MSSKPVLVTGATGRHGGTGMTVVRSLRNEGRAVRALVRVMDERAEALRALGAEVVMGDLHDRRSLLPALDGVEVAYFAYPVAGGVVDAAANFASVGRAGGLKRVVVMSMGVSNPDSPSHLGRAHWLSEELFEMAGLSCIHLRVMAFFVENLSLLHRADLLEGNVIRNSFGDVPFSWMTGGDGGKLAVAALLYPERFGNGAAVYPSGGPAFTHAQAAQMLGEHLGRPLSHVTVAPEVWRERLMTLGKIDKRINADMARHISTLGGVIQRAMPTNDMFQKVTGEKPVTLPDAIKAGGVALG